MLRVVTGRFHPHLETALVDHLARAKADDPFAPVAVLIPSASLCDRLRHCLAVERGLSLLNVHLLTFHQFALRLSDERRIGGEPAASPRVVTDLFFEQLIRRIARRQLPSLAPVQQLGLASGAWGALWSTIRDLKDAGVDPAQALQGVREGLFDREDGAWLKALFTFHAAVQESGRALNAGTADDLAASLIPAVPHSKLIASLRQVFYYGFYDLTQVQLALFEAVNRTAPTTLFFPLEPDESYGFARRFFDRHIQPLIAGPDAVTHLGSPPRPPGQDRVVLAISSVIGAEEELATVCRTILELVETNGYRFDEIGVVARTLDPYRSALQPVFDRHRIPFAAGAGRPAIHHPLCKIALQLASLPINRFYRTAVLDVVTSPFYRLRPEDASSDHLRRDLWKLVVPALGITRDREEWSRLEAASRARTTIEGEEDAGAAAAPLDIEPEVIGLLWRTVSRLLNDYDALPARGSIGELTAAFGGLIERHLRRDPSVEAGGDGSRSAAAWDAIDRILGELDELTVLGDEMAWAEFVDLLTHAMERATVLPDSDPHLGVTVSDAMTARGLPFKALFVLGLNEKVFPRYIREDAFLRDRHRRVLDATLGYKIDEKLAGYDEETLLISLLCGAAGRRLYLSYHRADEAGRASAPSPYLAEVACRLGVEGPDVDVVPRRLTDRAAQRPSHLAYLPPADLVCWMAMRGEDPSLLHEAVGGDAGFLRHGLEALDRIEDETGSLTPFDGFTGPLDAHWTALRRRGFAPTPLERYARCPFQYFAADVLRLAPVRVPTPAGIDPTLLGTFCHAALRYCYESLVPTGWPAEPVTDDTVAWSVHHAVERASAECEAAHRTGHYVLWELAKETVVSLVTAAVESDESAYRDAPFIPVAFETDADGMLPDGVTVAGERIKVHGRLDRIDRHRETGALRIIDYKFKSGSQIASEDRSLLQAAVRGARLQPPLYTTMSAPGQSPPDDVQLFFLAPHWPSPVVRSTFAANAWSSAAGPLLSATIAALAEGIRAGRFFILPDGYCDHCEFRVACRREHHPTWWRAFRAPEAKALRTIRLQRVSDD